jgi:hypothetical protein
MHLQAPDIDHQAEARARLWESYCAVAKRLDPADLIAIVCEQLQRSTDTPLGTLIEDWLFQPEFDWAHPLLPPSMCEQLGRDIATVVSRAIQAAFERSCEARF